MLKKLRHAYLALVAVTAIRFKNAQRASARARQSRAAYLAEPTKAHKKAYLHDKSRSARFWAVFRHSRDDREGAKAVYQKAKTSTPREKFIRECAKYVGKVEATGNNDGAWVLKLQRHTARGADYLDRAPYCGIGMENCAAAIGCKTVPQWASVAAIEDMARAGTGGFERWTTDRHSIPDGAIVLVVLFGRGVHVEGVNDFKSDHLDSIGFNTSSGVAGSQSNGGGVYRRQRLYSQVHGYAVVRNPA